MPVHLPSQPDASPLDGVGFRALLGRTLPRLIERLGDDAWPGHVQDELYAAVACGDPEEGFLWVSCDDCGVHRLVAVSCKGRGFWSCATPARCGGRRMAQGAANLVDDLLPRVPVRQWVLSMPMQVRLALIFRPDLVRSALGVVVLRLRAYYEKKTGGQTGLVTAIQRFGSRLYLNLHFHILALDGGYHLDDQARLQFRASQPPRPAELSRMVQDIGRRLERLVNRAEADDEPDPHRQLQLLAATGGDVTDPAHRSPRRFEPSRQLRRYEASYGYFSLEAGSRTGAQDRRGLERLCRYILRPAVALSRLGIDREDRVVLTLRHPWRDGTTALRFEGGDYVNDFVARLAALVPPRGQHTVRYHGVLAPASPWRRKVVARPRPVGVRRRTWIPWDQLVLRTFGHDPLRCPQCDARMRQRAIVRSSAGDVLAWLEEHAKLLLVGPPPRDGPSDA
jgi:hypothetical protein